MFRCQATLHLFFLEDSGNPHCQDGNVGTKPLAPLPCTPPGWSQAAPLYPISCQHPHPQIAPSSPCLERSKFMFTSESCTLSPLLRIPLSGISAPLVLSHYSTPRGMSPPPRRLPWLPCFICFITLIVIRGEWVQVLIRPLVPTPVEMGTPRGQGDRCPEERGSVVPAQQPLDRTSRALDLWQWSQNRNSV